MVIALKRIMDEKGLTAIELAEKTGLTKAAVWNYSSGRNAPDPETLCLLADALDVSLDYLVRGKEKDRHEGRSMEELLTMYRNLSDEQLDYLTALMQAVKADRQFQAHLRQVEKEGQ